jgi:heat-inducible transcriptional repressor
MADLEEMGYLRQPHTSAGRIPTDSGYRFYVDAMTPEKISQNREDFIELYNKLEMLRKDINSFPDRTSKVLSSLSHYIGVIMSENERMITLSKIELIKYRRNRLAVVLFAEEGMVKNKVVTIDPDVSQRALNRIANYINSEFSGSSIQEIKTILLTEIEKDKSACNEIISEAINICRSIFTPTEESIYISGISDMLDLPDFCDVNRVRELFKAIEDKQIIVKLLDTISDTEGTQVFIGSENPLDEMKQFSLVVSTFKELGKPIGAIGLLGPRRMNYAKAISIVDITAKYITNMLTRV